ncbi:MAG TPA: T9SS type A sorting domain-containing protein [Lutibacter sp.]|nr:T9SS type A sorting domain-containing protein [Lutibacter sp.]
MKKSFLIIIVFFSFYSFSQDYVPMLAEGKTWEMQRTTYMVPPNFTTEIIYFSYYIEGTIVINSQEYFVLKNNGDGEITHYLREDTTNKIVYEYFTETQTELVLFDFNATVGDVFDCTFQVDGWVLCNEGYTSTIITEIGAITIYNASRKYFIVDVLDENNNVWDSFTAIEGIGFSNNGLFNSHCPSQPTDLPDYTLLSVNSMGIDSMNNNNTFSVFFQKNTSQLVIKDGDSSYILKLYSVTGKKVLNTKISDVVNISHLIKGVYLYHLTSDDMTTRGKVIIY